MGNGDQHELAYKPTLAAAGGDLAVWDLVWAAMLTTGLAGPVWQRPGS